MSIKFYTMSENDLQEYVKDEEANSNFGLKANNLNWKYDAKFNLSNIEDHESWVDWIDLEREMWNDDLGYDRVKEIQEYWLSNPEIEPIIIAVTSEGKYDIWDGNHRMGIAIKNKLQSVPVIIGNIN